MISTAVSADIAAPGKVVIAGGADCWIQDVSC
jgi:hypothetical protein